jgi:hypothetical protein
VIVAAMVTSAALAKDNVKLSGVVRAGYEVRERVGPQAEVEVRFKTRRVHGTRGVVKMEGRYFRDSVDIERAFIEHEVNKALEFRVGLDKKRLGLEYEQGNRQRLTTDRSWIYQEMDQLGIVGRQLSARVLSQPLQDVHFDASLGVDGSRDGNLLLRLTHEPLDFGYGTWALIERHRVDKHYVPLWAQAVSAWYIGYPLRVVAEVLVGIDPLRSELQQFLGSSRKVFFAGPKVELAVKVPVAESVVVEPLIQASALWHDLEETRQQTVQVVAGANVYVWDLLIAVEGQYLAERNLGPQGRLAPRFPRFLVQARYYY